MKSPVAVLGGGGGLICLPCGVFFITSNPFGNVLATTNITGPHVMFPSSHYSLPNYWVLFLTMNERVWRQRILMTALGPCILFPTTTFLRIYSELREDTSQHWSKKFSIWNNIPFSTFIIRNKKKCIRNCGRILPTRLEIKIPENKFEKKIPFTAIIIIVVS